MSRSRVLAALIASTLGVAVAIAVVGRPSAPTVPAGKPSPAGAPRAGEGSTTQPASTPPQAVGDVVEIDGRRFVPIGANGLVRASTWTRPEEGPYWDAERAWWDARRMPKGEQRTEALRVATERRGAVSERLENDPNRRRVLAARLAVLGYRLHASATGLEEADALAQMVTLEFDAVSWLLKGRTDAEGADALVARARPWCEAGLGASDRDVVARARACLE